MFVCCALGAANGPYGREGLAAMLLGPPQLPLKMGGLGIEYSVGCHDARRVGSWRGKVLG